MNEKIFETNSELYQNQLKNSNIEIISELNLQYDNLLNSSKHQKNSVNFLNL